MLERDDILHLNHRGEPEPGLAPENNHPARRWVGERTHAWQHKFRRLLVRWERLLDSYKAMVCLASVFILYRLVTSA
jgi:putative transposase